MPLFQMVLYSTVWNQECVQSSKSRIGKEVLSFGYIQIVGMCIVPHHSISRWPVPSGHCVCEQKVEITDKQTVLQYRPLSVPHIRMFLSWYKHMDMRPIDCPNTVRKVSEVAIIQDFSCDRCIGSRQLHVCQVEQIRWEKINHFPEIPANHSAVCLS